MLRSVVLSFLLVFSIGCSRQPAKPNVVLIIIDTLRADKLGAYGFPSNTSPELDQLAKDGVIFNRVMAQASWTRPSIGSFLTSQYPRTLGIYQEQWDALPAEAETAAEIFKSSGYNTIGVTANPNINTSFGFGQGFDDYSNSEVLFHWMDQNHGVDLDRHPSVVNKSTVAKSASDFEQTRPPASKVYSLALENLAKSSSEPFYLQINIMDVHGGHKIPLKDVDPDLRDQKDPGYLQSVRIASRETGQFIESIKKTTKSPTLFVILSDHGEGLSDHPGVPNSSGHGKYLYESVLSVPWILYGSNLDRLPHARITQQVRLLDVLPTVLDIVGIKSKSQLEGISMRPLIEQRTDTLAIPASYSETHMRGADKIAIHSQSWGLIENRDHWSWLDAEELQSSGGHEQGKKSNKIGTNSEVANSLKMNLSGWNSGYSSRPPLSASPEQIGTTEINRLRSLGYIK